MWRVGCEGGVTSPMRDEVDVDEADGKNDTAVSFMLQRCGFRGRCCASLLYSRSALLLLWQILVMFLISRMAPLTSTLFYPHSKLQTPYIQMERLGSSKE